MNNADADPLPVSALEERARSNLVGSLKTLSISLGAMAQIAAGVTVVGLIVWAVMVYVAVHFGPLREALTVLISLAIAFGVLNAKKNFGDAALALIAGLLPALTITWTEARFVVFAFSYLTLALLAFLIWSVVLASRKETAYVLAGIAASDYLGTEASAKLQRLGDAADAPTLGPVERAEILHALVVRRIREERLARAG